MNKDIYSSILLFTCLEKFIPVMSQEESLLLLNGCLSVNDGLLKEWERRLAIYHRHRDEIVEKIRKANAKQR